MSAIESGFPLQRIAFLALVAAAGMAMPKTGEAQILTELNPDNKVVPGASCQPTNTRSLGNFEVRASGIKNIDDTAQWVTCSLTTDSEASWNSYSVPLVVTGHADVYVTLDNSAVAGTAQTTCVAQVSNAGAAVESLGGTGVNVQGAISEVVMSGMEMGSAQDSQPLAVSCLLPPGAKLTSVRVEETTLTDQSLLGGLLGGLPL